MTVTMRQMYVERNAKVRMSREREKKDKNCIN